MRCPHESHLSIDQHRPNVSRKLPRESYCSLRPVPRAVNLSGRAWARRRFVDVHHDIRIKHPDEPFKVAGPYGSEKGVGDVSLFCEAGCGNRGCALHSPACPARELSRSLWRAAENRSNLIANIYAATNDFMRPKWLLGNMSKLGVPESSLPVRGALKAAGALGLLIGLAVPLIGIAAAVGLTLFFIGAVNAHLRARDLSVGNGVPVIFLVVVLAALVLGIYGRGSVR